MPATNRELPTEVPAGSLVLAGSVGSALEWFDFAVYGYLAPVMGKLFFPNADAIAVLLSVFAVFSVGHILRPAGAVLLGHIGDRYGRKRMLLLGVSTMGLASGGIALLPTFAQAGIWAPILLVVLRALQGLSVGGEYTGAMAYTAECAPLPRRGFFTSLVTVGSLVGMAAGSAVAALLQYGLDEKDLLSWGWRVPFAAGVVIAALGALMRMNMHESVAFKRADKVEEAASAWKAVRLHWRLMLRIVALVSGANIAFFTGFVYLPDALAQRMPEQAGVIAGITAAVLMVQTMFVVLGGWLSDRFGRRRISFIFRFVTLAVAVPAMRYGVDGTIVGMVIAQLLFTVPVGVITGLQGALVSELSPSDHRCSVVSISFGTAIAVFAGNAPLIAAWMIGRKGWVDGPAIYIMVMVAISLVVMSLSKPVRPTDMK